MAIRRSAQANAAVAVDRDAVTCARLTDVGADGRFKDCSLRSLLRVRPQLNFGVSLPSTFSARPAIQSGVRTWCGLDTACAEPAPAGSDSDVGDGSDIGDDACAIRCRSRRLSHTD